MKKLLFGTLIGSLLMGGVAYATPMMIEGDVLVQEGSEKSLQTILNENFELSGGGDLDVIEDQNRPGGWNFSEGDTSGYMIEMLRGDSGYLGIYSLLDKNNSELLFDVDSGDLKTSIEVLDGKSIIRRISSDGLTVTSTLLDWDLSGGFGFFWANTSKGTNAYTQDYLNDPMEALAVTYLVPHGADLTGVLNDQSDARGNDDWVIAFEDSVNGDYDFNDAVFYMEDMAPVPEPGTLLLLGSGLAGLAAAKRRKKS